MSGQEELKDREAMQRQILEKAERHGLDATFRFRCDPGVSCFNRCCRDVNIVLTPYDIVRLKSALGMTSTEFLERHTITPFTKEMKFPIVFLKMEEDEEKSCPFVTAEGCSVYENRPWPCRIYPVGLAAPKGNVSAGDEGRFYFFLREAHCKGFDEGEKQWSIMEWLDDQGVVEYERANEGYKYVTLHDFFVKGGNLLPEKMEMFHMACYDVDRFRRFVFESTFLKRFDVPAETVERIRADDVAMLEFAIEWLKFSLFGEKPEGIRIRQEVLEEKQKELELKARLSKERRRD